LETPLGALSLREQFYFFKVVSQRNVGNINPIKAFARTYGVGAFRTFLSLEYEHDLGDEIIAFGNSIDSRTARAIFERYGEILDASEQAREILTQVFGREGVSSQTRGFLAEALAKRGKDILLAAVRTPKNATDVLSNLASVNTEAVVFANAFRTLKESHELDLETIRDTSLSISPSAEFRTRTKDIEKVDRLFAEAYKDQPAEFREAVLNSFHKSLSNPDARFYALRRKDEVIASLRFDDIRNEKGEVTRKYFGSFVSDTAYGNGKLGEAVFENAIAAEATSKIPIQAHCNPLSPITQKYIESGFVATGLENYAGVPSFSIELDSSRNEGLETKKWPPEQIVRAALSQNTSRIRAFSVTNPEQIPFDLVQEGFALTRYLKIDRVIYAVFELLPAEGKTSA
jgi:predicted GNAT family N-acyltransferase